MSKTKVSGIELDIKGKKITLNMEEAREIYAGLSELFEDQSKPIFIPSSPVIIERDRYPYWPRLTWTSDKTTPSDNFQITCKDILNPL